MKTIKKVSVTLATLLLGLVVVGLCPFMGMKAEAAAPSDTHGEWVDCGTDCQYMFDSSSGKLTIVPKENASGTPSVDYRAGFYHLWGENNGIIELDIKGDATNPIKIGEGAFAGNLDLEKVTLSDVSSIYKSAFAECTALETVVLPKGINTIPEAIFFNCEKLENITIPSSVTTINKRAFSSCESLKSIVIPNSVDTIISEAFACCTGLDSVTLPSGLTNLGDIFTYEYDGPKVKLKELIFSGAVPTTIDTQFKNWLKDPNISGSSGSLEKIVVPDEHIEAYIGLLKEYGIDSDKVNALVVKYSEAFPNGRDDNDDGHEGGGSNDDESRPAPPTPNQMAQELILRLLEEQIAAMDSSTNRQATIDGNELVNGLPNATMKRIADTPNAVVFFKFIYDGVHYTTAIPTDAVFDTSVDWYGPLYMMNVFPTMQETATGAVPYIPVVAPVQ